MEKIKEYKGIIIMVLVILGIVFYWVSIRPVIVKRNCSSITEVLPADAGITKEQAEINRKIYDEKCITGDEYQGSEQLQSFKCFLLKRDTIERFSRVEKEETRKATEREYNQCLREHGL